MTAAIAAAAAPEVAATVAKGAGAAKGAAKGAGAAKGKRWADMTPAERDVKSKDVLGRAEAARERIAAESAASPSPAAVPPAAVPPAAPAKLDQAGDVLTKLQRKAGGGDGGGLLLALIGYPLVLSVIKYGPAGPKMWFMAKFLNRTPDAPDQLPWVAGTRNGTPPGAGIGKGSGLAPGTVGGQIPRAGTVSGQRLGAPLVQLPSSIVNA